MNRSRILIGLVATALVTLGLGAVGQSPASASFVGNTICGNAIPPGGVPALKHFIVIKPENQSWDDFNAYDGTLPNGFEYNTLTSGPGSAPLAVNQSGSANTTYHSDVSNQVNNKGLEQLCSYSDTFAGTSHISTDNYFTEMTGWYPTDSLQDCSSGTGSLCDSDETVLGYGSNYAPFPAGSVQPFNYAPISIYRQMLTNGNTFMIYQQENATVSPVGSDCNNNPSYRNRDPIKWLTTTMGGTMSLATCQAHDKWTPDLTDTNVANNPFAAALANRTLPQITELLPDKTNMSEVEGTDPTLPCFQNVTKSLVNGTILRKCRITLSDAWIGKMVKMITASADYQAGNTAIAITYDEGSGWAVGRSGIGDTDTKGQDCLTGMVSRHTTEDTNAAQTAGLTWLQDNPSCFVPFFIVYPYAPAGYHYPLQTGANGALYEQNFALPSVFITEQDLLGLNRTVWTNQTGPYSCGSRAADAGVVTPCYSSFATFYHLPGSIS